MIFDFLPILVFNTPRSFGGTNCPTDKPNCEANVNRREPRGGQDFCTWAPDDTCFESGWPQCCDEDEDQPCPEAQPRCDIGEEGETGCKLVQLFCWSNTIERIRNLYMRT